MAVYIKTNKPQELLDELKDFINKGTIDTWSYDSDGDFTHSAKLIIGSVIAVIGWILLDWSLYHR